jgi:hypothetical protein
MATSELSQAKLFPDGQADDRLTSSLEVSRVSPFLSPGSAWARRMTAISGQKCSGSLTSFGPTESLVRTLLATSRWGSTRCYLTWKHSVTPAGRSLFLLRPSAPRTGGIASGFWPTPRHEGFDAGAHRGNPDSLHSAVKMWPTPRASENKNRQTKPTPSQLAGTHGKSLAAEVMVAEGFFPTPSASDNRDRGHANMPAIKRRMEIGKQVMLSMQVQQGPGQKLSADWVTRLMGYPDGWMNDLPVDPLANVASTLNAYQRARQKTMDMLVMDPDHPPMDGKSEQAS